MYLELALAVWIRRAFFVRVCNRKTLYGLSNCNRQRTVLCYLTTYCLVGMGKQKAGTF